MFRGELFNKLCFVYFIALFVCLSPKKQQVQAYVKCTLLPYLTCFVGELVSPICGGESSSVVGLYPNFYFFWLFPVSCHCTYAARPLCHAGDGLVAS